MSRYKKTGADLQVLRGVKQFLNAIIFTLIYTSQHLYCQETEISVDFYLLTYYCDDTDFRQFQETVANQTALKVTFELCVKDCLMVNEELFVKAIHMKTLWLSYGQDNIEDVCSSVRVSLGNQMFAGLSSLTELYLEGFEKTVLDPEVFKPLGNLRSLRLERFGLERLNHSELAEAMTAFSGTPLENIELNAVFGELSRIISLNIEELFQIKNVSIKRLAFDNNIVQNIYGRVSKALPDLQIASFSVQLKYSISLSFIFDAMISTQSLEQLHIYSYPSDIKSEIDYSKFLLRDLPKDIVAKLFEEQDTSCYWNYKTPLSPKLRELRLNGLEFLKIPIGGAKLCFQDANVLEMLDLSGCPLPSQLPLIVGLRNLKELSVKNVGIRSVSPFQLQENQQLRILDVAENDLDEAILQIIFNVSDGRNLEIFNASNCNLHWIPEDIATYLGSVKLLDLSQNHLTSADLRLENCPNITLLNVSSNDIENLSAFSMDELKKAAEKNENFVIDLRSNPLSCLCNATTFPVWMQQLGGQHLYGYDGYTCLHPNGSEIIVARADWSDIEAECAVLKDITPNGSCPCDLEVLKKLSRVRSSLTDYWCKNANGKVVQMSTLDPTETSKQCFVIYRSAAFLVPLILGLTIIATLVITILVLHRLKKQKRIEYLLPDCLNPDRIIGTLMALIYKQRDGARSFQYQAFVVYHKNDFSAVRQPIINKLSSEVNITTPDDFEFGALRMEEIERCINDSKWIVLLLTQDFVNDGNCKEIVVRAVQRQHAVIPVVLETLDLQSEGMIQSLLSTNIHFVWSQEMYQQVQIVQSVIDMIVSKHVMA